MTNANNLELNQGDNFIFCMDVSGSMGTSDCPGGVTRIQFCKEKAIQFANEASKYDPDGIDVLTFGHQVKHFPNVSAEKSAELIGKLQATEGATFTHQVIEQAYQLHKAGGYDQTVCFVVTDGAPSDPNAVKETIRRIAAEIPKSSDGGESFAFAISILTVGRIDPALRAFLTELDDSLNAAQDIVDVKALEDVDFISAFVGALHD